MYGQDKCDDMSLPSAYKVIDDINPDVKIHEAGKN